MKQRTKTEIEEEIKKVAGAQKTAAKKLERCKERRIELDMELIGANAKELEGKE